VRVLVGRDRQVGQLQSSIDALSEGRGGLLLIAAEAGLGKTRLAEEAIRLAQDAGIDTQRVTCWADEGAPPFWPWSQLLRAIGSDVIAITRTEDDREFARFRLFNAVADELRDVAATSARLLVIDDLHWADPPTVHLLAFLAPVFADHAIVVVGTYRDSEINGSSDLGAVLPDLVRHCRVLPLSPLEPAELAAFVADLTGGEVTNDLVSRLHVLTAGNPLFAREVVSLLEAEGGLGGAGELPVPDSVLSTLTRRLDAVRPACRDLLGVASVVGVEFAVEVVAAAANADGRALLTALDEAERARLVRAARPGRFAFTHPLIRETAYRELGLARRVRIHEEVARVLEAQVARGIAVDPAELAHHYGRASAGGAAAKAVAYARLAGDRAMAMLAYEAAVAHYEQALDTLSLCPPDPALRTDLLLQLGDARLAEGNLPGARAPFDEAARLARDNGWPDRLARAALGRGSGRGGFEVASFDTEQIALLREAIAAIGPDDVVTHAWLLARLSVALSMDSSYAERLALSDEAVSVARAAGDDRALAYALAARCDVIAGPDCCEARVEAATEIIALSHARGDAAGELLGRRLRVVALGELGRWREFDADVDAFERLADTIRQPLYAWYAPLWRGMRALMEGRTDDADMLCGRAEVIGELAHSENAAMLTVSQRLLWLMSTGRADECFARTMDIIDRWRDIGFMARPAAAMAATRVGDLDTARSFLARVSFEDRAAWGAEWLPGVAMAADAVARLDDRERAAQLYDELLPYRALNALDGIAAANWGSIERALGVLAAVTGRADAALEHFAAAVRRHRQEGATLLAEEAERDAAAFLGPSDAPIAPRTGSMRHEGDVWAVTYEGRTVRLKQSKGIADIARLLAQPGREIHVLDLAVDPRPPLTDTGPSIDSAARDAYKRRLVELDTEIEAADAAADLARSERLHTERDALLAELSSAYGLGGRARRTGDPAERARSAVTQRIRDALARIEGEHPGLGGHLRRAVKTGTFCAYEPDGPVDWEISQA
jgi:tetratricopeptide (TPR) repeat protein